MPPVNESVSTSGGQPVAINGVATVDESAQEEGARKFTFPSHQYHMVHLAKMCQENKDYTDCVIRVGEEELRAHRLVLGSVSPFLKLVFSDLPANHTEATILVPGVRQRVVKALLDFFYTGQMTVDRQDTSDLQLLIDTLQIDPGLITVNAMPESKGKENESAEATEVKSEPETSEQLNRRKRKHSPDDEPEGESLETSKAEKNPKKEEDSSKRE